MGPTFVKLGQLLSTRADLLPPRLPRGARAAAGQRRAVPLRARSRRSSQAELGRAALQGVRRVRADADRRGLARPGAPRRPARRPRGRGQGAAARHPRAGRRGPRGARARSPSFARRSTPSSARRYQLRRDARGVPPHPAARARLPRRRRTTCATLREQPRASSTASWCRGRSTDYTHRARAHHGLRAAAEDHRRSARSRASSSTARRSPTSSSAPTCKQILVDGFFHADPHPGNVFLTDDDRIALLDLGMVGRVSPGDAGAAAPAAARRQRRPRRGGGRRWRIRIGEPRRDFDAPRFRRARRRAGRRSSQDARLAEHRRSAASCSSCHARRGRARPARCRPSSRCSARRCSTSTRSAARSTPSFDPNAAIRRNAAELMPPAHAAERRRRAASSAPLLEMQGVRRSSCRRGSTGSSTRVANNELEVKVDAIDETLLIEGFQKVANRITRRPDPGGADRRRGAC